MYYKGKFYPFDSIQLRWLTLAWAGINKIVWPGGRFLSDQELARRETHCTDAWMRKYAGNKV